MRIILLSILSFYLLVIGCNPKQDQKVIDSDYIQGRKVYNKKCIGCHRPYMISEFTSEKWSAVLPVMYEKSNANPSEIFYIDYFVNHSKKKKNKIKEKKESY